MSSLARYGQTLIVTATQQTSPLAAPFAPQLSRLAGAGVQELAASAELCRPFTLSVKIFSPESGYRYYLEVEKSCSDDNEAIWRLVFTLEKEKADHSGFDLLVEVKYTASTPQENRGIARTGIFGTTLAQDKILNKSVYPAIKSINEAGGEPSEDEKRVINASMQEVATRPR
jgi:hypothetical protein